MDHAGIILVNVFGQEDVVALPERFFV